MAACCSPVVTLWKKGTHQTAQHALLAIDTCPGRVKSRGANNYLARSVPVSSGAGLLCFWGLVGVGHKRWDQVEKATCAGACDSERGQLSTGNPPLHGPRGDFTGAGEFSHCRQGKGGRHAGRISQSAGCQRTHGGVKTKNHHPLWSHPPGGPLVVVVVVLLPFGFPPVVCVGFLH